MRLSYRMAIRPESTRRRTLSLVGVALLRGGWRGSPPGVASGVAWSLARQVDGDGSVPCEEEACVENDADTVDEPGVAPPAPLDVVVAVVPGRDHGLAFVVTATNRLDVPLALRFRNGQWCDVSVVGADGAPVWRWSAGKVFTQAIRDVLLDPGEAREVRLEWDMGGMALASAAAPLTAWATWVSDPGGSAPPTTFDLESLAQPAGA